VTHPLAVPAEVSVRDPVLDAQHAVRPAQLRQAAHEPHQAPLIRLQLVPLEVVKRVVVAVGVVVALLAVAVLVAHEEHGRALRHQQRHEVVAHLRGGEARAEREGGVREAGMGSLSYSERSMQKLRIVTGWHGATGNGP
jgi:hypothetical protein